MQDFSLKNIPNLDVCLLGALELFHKEKLQDINISYKKPLVVGSGNAEITGRILFHDLDAVFASESNFEEKLKTIKKIDGVVIISASGGKHAPIIAKKSKSYNKHITVLTNNINAKVIAEADQKYIFPKQREPYTYNTSTYLGMILSKTKEDPKIIYEFIKKIDKIKLPNFSRYDKYFLIIPSSFELIKRMFQVKFIELFGRRIARDIETFEYMKHAVTVVPSNELFISFGEKNNNYGKKENRLFIPLPKKADYGSLLSIGYYIIGKIQKSKPSWFKENIEDYVKKVSELFKSDIKVIVE